MKKAPITDRPESESLARRGAESIAGGVVSLNRRTDPPISFVRAQGSRLWDADGTVASHHDFDLDRRYRRVLLDRGVFLFPLACKQGSISAAHTNEDLALTLDVTREALKSL